MSRTAQFVKNLRPFRLVTFDITDTLLCFRDTPAVQYARTAEQLGVTNINQERLQQCFRTEFKAMTSKYPNFGYSTPEMSWQQWWILLVENIFTCIDKNIPADKLRQIAVALLDIYRTRTCWSHVNGGRELLQKVRDADKMVGVISNFDPSLVNVLREMEIDNKFHFILTSFDAGVQKPHAKIFKIPLERYKVKPNEALHIGNLYDVDYMGARNSGWCSLLVAKNADDAKGANPMHVYDSIASMLNALETTTIQW